ncbi:MAG: glutaredoxin family protein [Elainellaceae cyanobacterium]
MRLILFSKPGCHLCEGLQEKLDQVREPQFELEVRDITTNADWFNAYQYEIPVLVAEPEAAGEGQGQAMRLPRLSPRASVQQLEKLLQKYL